MLHQLGSKQRSLTGKQRNQVLTKCLWHKEVVSEVNFSELKEYTRSVTIFQIYAYSDFH